MKTIKFMLCLAILFAVTLSVKADVLLPLQFGDALLSVSPSNAAQQSFPLGLP